MILVKEIKSNSRYFYPVNNWLPRPGCCCVVPLVETCVWLVWSMDIKICNPGIDWSAPLHQVATGLQAIQDNKRVFPERMAITRSPYLRVIIHISALSICLRTVLTVSTAIRNHRAFHFPLIFLLKRVKLEGAVVYDVGSWSVHVSVHSTAVNWRLKVSDTRCR